MDYLRGSIARPQICPSTGDRFLFMAEDRMQHAFANDANDLIVHRKPSVYNDQTNRGFCVPKITHDSYCFRQNQIVKLNPASRSLTWLLSSSATPPD